LEIFITSESSEDVSKLIDELRDTSIESEINKKLSKINLNTDYEKWGLIYYCVAPKFADFFRETQVARKKPKSIEHRIQIDYETFHKSNSKERFLLLINAIKKSIDWMGGVKFKVSSGDQEILRQVIDDISSELIPSYLPR
jgi:Immunity protein 44